MKEVLDLLPPKQRYECCDCHKHYTHIEKCKDGKERCKHCKKSMVTNKFYNPNWKQNLYIGKFSVNSQEYNMLIEKYKKQGFSVLAAKSKVNYDLNCMRKNKQRIFAIAKSEEKKKEDFKKQNEEFLRGLGQK